IRDFHVTGVQTCALPICLVVLVSILLLMATHTLQWQYAILAAVAYSLFGLGLAFYATPSTDAALTNLPGDQAGAGSGIYKMASRSEERRVGTGGKTRRAA